VVWGLGHPAHLSERLLWLCHLYMDNQSSARLFFSSATLHQGGDFDILIS
jgi:hypothetical protein